MKRKLVYSMCGFILAALIPTSSYAQNLLNYQLGAASSGPVAPNFVADNVVGMNLSRGAEVSNLVGGSGAFGANNWELGTGNLANATNRYISFGFVVDPVHFAELSMISFVGESNINGPRDLAIRSSLDNFGSDLFNFSAKVESQPDLFTADVNFDASVLGPVMGQVEFRIYQTSLTTPNGGGIASNGWFRIRGPGGSNSISIVGDVAAIPEPGTCLALGGVSLVTLLRRRR